MCEGVDETVSENGTTSPLSALNYVLYCTVKCAPAAKKHSL